MLFLYLIKTISHRDLRRSATSEASSVRVKCVKFYNKSHNSYSISLFTTLSQIHARFYTFYTFSLLNKKYNDDEND
jgi:hypothetical protein